MINRSALIRMVTALVNELPAADSPFSEQLCLEYGGVLVVIRPTAGHMVARPSEAQPKNMMRLPKAKPAKKAPRPKRPSEIKAAAEKQALRPAASNGKADKAKATATKADKAQPATVAQ